MIDILIAMLIVAGLIYFFHLALIPALFVFILGCLAVYVYRRAIEGGRRL